MSSVTHLRTRSAVLSCSWSRRHCSISRICIPVRWLSLAVEGGRFDRRTANLSALHADGIACPMRIRQPSTTAEDRGWLDSQPIGNELL